MDKVIDFIKAHPIAVTAIVVFVFVWFLLSGSSEDSGDAKTAAANASMAQSIATSQQAAAQYQANVNDNAAKIALATIAGKVQEAYIASNLNAVAINANLEQQANKMSVLQTIADTTFGIASQAVSANYRTQLDAARGVVSSGGTTTSTSGNTTTTTTVSNSGDPAGVNEINTANTYLQEMYTNLLKAVSGRTDFTQNAIITTGGMTTTTTSSSTTTPNLPVDPPRDPIFVNLVDPNKLPTVTDVTPGIANGFGWMGSFVDPNTGFQLKIG